MGKVIDFVTVSRPIIPATAEATRLELKARYLDQGWDLFYTSVFGQVQEELHMVYVFVKREPDAVAALEAPSFASVEVGKRRGRPKKVEAVVEE
jgi:hypothetical protein